MSDEPRDPRIAALLDRHTPPVAASSQDWRGVADATVPSRPRRVAPAVVSVAGAAAVVAVVGALVVVSRGPDRSAPGAPCSPTSTVGESPRPSA